MSRSHEVIYTRHAEERLLKWDLDRAWVQRTIDGPDFQTQDLNDPTLQRLFRSIPERGGRMMRVVVCFETETRCRVVTVHLDRSMRKRRI